MTVGATTSAASTPETATRCRPLRALPCHRPFAASGVRVRGGFKRSDSRGRHDCYGAVEPVLRLQEVCKIPSSGKNSSRRTDASLRKSATCPRGKYRLRVGIARKHPDLGLSPVWKEPSDDA